jgi:beta-galactosidase/beta-glucuronidase
VDLDAEKGLRAKGRLGYFIQDASKSFAKETSMRGTSRAAVIAAATVLAVIGTVSAETLPRPEYPRPEMVRDEWLNLNGEWDFALDLSMSGEERGLPDGAGFDRKIIVPFAPESILSGVGFKDFIRAAWYKRTFALPAAWRGKRILLHFEACDHTAAVWVNGRKAGGHQGGYTPFTLDVTKHLVPGENTIVVEALDDTRSGLQPTGKQSDRFASYGCMYTRTTGLWQTVWLEPVAAAHILKYRVVPDIDNARALITVTMSESPAEGRLRLRVTREGRREFEAVAKAAPAVTFGAVLKSPALWGIGHPSLYDLEITYERGAAVEDKIVGYFGMRKFEVRGNKFYLNNAPIFLRTVLDQGFYPDGVYTAPSDEALKRDIELSMSFGFDGARLHQRVFERRFLYWADRLGYLVWGEFSDWGLDLGRPETALALDREWSEAVERDVNHPCIIGWCPLNERWGENYPGLIANLFALTKRLDPARPALDASGGYHEAVPDVYDAHDYDQDAASLKKTFDGLLASPPAVYVNANVKRHTAYVGQPYYVSEYGGIWWNPGQTDGKAWGYGDRPKNLEEFLERYKRLTEVLLANPAVAGFCYTQLYDIEQEVNGLMTFDRRPKHDPAYFRKINQQPAAIEKLP